MSEKIRAEYIAMIEKRQLVKIKALALCQIFLEFKKN